jgi:hypothetical protein
MPSRQKLYITSRTSEEIIPVHVRLILEVDFYTMHSTHNSKIDSNNFSNTVSISEIEL